MPIEVITGQPGNGKSLLMMERLDQESRKTVEQGRRVLVACGIEGLAPGLVDIELDSGKDWNERNDQGEYLVPDGSLIFVDEAWKWFGHLHDARQAPTPLHVLQLAEHRHRGLDFVWTTQQPNQIYPFVRGLIGTHKHVARKMGTKVTEIYEWGELVEDVKSQAMRDKALSRVWVHPKHLFDKYKSATVHTIKSRIPWKVWLLPFLFLAGIALAIVAYHMLKPSAMASNFQAKGAAEGGLPAPAAPPAAIDAPPRTAAEWKAAMTPTLPGIAYSMPIVASSLTLQTHPRTLCVVTQQQPGDSCHCYTEQATPLAVADQVCREIALHGYYDPFRPEPQQAAGGSTASSSSSSPASLDSSSAAAAP